MHSASQGHPRGLYLLFATEMWERFSYYGNRALLALFMLGALAFDKQMASHLYGSYTALACQSARNFDHLSALNFDQVSGGYCGA